MTFGVWKPWFLYRPRQIVRRLLFAVRPPSSTSSTVDTSWGGRVIVDRTRAIRRDNDGMAMLADGGPASVQAVQVVVERLDDLIDTGASMLKLDVEGFEASVLRGAQRLLSERRLRHIVFEDHDVERSAVVRLLKVPAIACSRSAGA